MNDSRSLIGNSIRPSDMLLAVWTTSTLSTTMGRRPAVYRVSYQVSIMCFIRKSVSATKPLDHGVLAQSKI
jgi:hypothetical protein